MAPEVHIIEDYTLGPLLGEGLTGKTHMATATEANGNLRQVVVKLCHPTRSTLKPWIAMLTRERDARLVRYESVGGQGPDWSGYYATDKVRAQDYRELWEESSFVERLRLLRNVAEAVALLHANDSPLVHGFLKPSNVLVRRERSGRLAPLITDIGIVPRFLREFHDQPEQATRLYPYMAPEAILAFRTEDPLPEDPALDVYSLGALACVLLTGCAPGLAEGERTAAEILASKRRRSYFVHALIDPDSPVDLEVVNRLLQRALSANPEERPSAIWFADAIQASLGPRGTMSVAREEALRAS